MNDVTTTDAAALLEQRGVSHTGGQAPTPENVARWARRGYFVGAHKIGRDWLIPRSSVEAFEPPRAGWRAGRKRKNDDGLHEQNS